MLQQEPESNHVLAEAATDSHGYAQSKRKALIADGPREALADI
jgi:hypothetical protein